MGEWEAGSRGRGYIYIYLFPIWASQVAQWVNNPPAMQKMLVQSQCPQDPLEEGMATHFSIPAWRIPMDRGAWQDTVHGVKKSRT